MKIDFISNYCGSNEKFPFLFCRYFQFKIIELLILHFKIECLTFFLTFSKSYNFRNALS